MGQRIIANFYHSTDLRWCEYRDRWDVTHIWTDIQRPGTMNACKHCADRPFYKRNRGAAK